RRRRQERGGSDRGRLAGQSDRLSLPSVPWARQAVSGPTIPPNRRGEQPDFEGRIMKDYHINIFYSQEDEGYIADIPDLRYCSAFGRTPAEALAGLELDKAAWLAPA